MPICPVCGNSLSYVEHAIVRNEYPVVSLDVDVADITGQVFLLPVYDNAGKDSIVMEVLERTIHCSSITCQYRVDDEDLGEALPSEFV